MVVEKDLISDLQRCSTVSASFSFRREEVKKTTPNVKEIKHS